MSLTANQKRALRRLWTSDSTTEDICDDLEMSPEQLAAAAVELGLPPRVEPECYCPTPDEIRRAAAALRLARGCPKAGDETR